MSCQNKDCDDRCFKKPKSYAAIMKEHRELMLEHIDSLTQIESHTKTIETLRSLNASLIQKIKDAEENIKKADENIKKAEEKVNDAEKKSIQFEEQRNVFLRTYTNMSIEMLKLEDKLAKYEGRIF
jgi:uncharacterized phage infection (PIP) family protein YhgE